MTDRNIADAMSERVEEVAARIAESDPMEAEQVRLAFCFGMEYAARALCLEKADPIQVASAIAALSGQITARLAAGNRPAADPAAERRARFQVIDGGGS